MHDCKSLKEPYFRLPIPGHLDFFVATGAVVIVCLFSLSRACGLLYFNAIANRIVAVEIINK